MNPPSLAKALERISEDRRRARVHRQMALLWIAIALLLVGFILTNRYYGFDYGPIVGPFSGIAVIAALMLFFRKGKPVNLQDVARDVERSDPKLNTLLLAAYEQQQAAGAEGLSYLQERVVLEALEANRRSPWGEKFAQRFFFTALGHACAVLVFVVALGAAFAMAPGGVAAHVFQRTVQVTPGDAEIERGSALAVMAKFPNPAPAEVKLVVTPKNGPAQVLRMDRALEDPVFGAGFAEVKEDFKYQIQFGEKKSEEFTIKVFEYPALKRADANLKFPEFTGLAEKRIDDTRRVTAVEGTMVDYRLELNKPVKTAALQPKEGAPIELQQDATHPNIYHAKIDLRTSQKLALRLKDADGRTNKLDELVLEAVANKQPDLKIVFPRGDQRVSAIEELALQAEARDDFGLGAYGLAYSVGGGDPIFVQIGASGNANEKKTLEHLLRLEALKATTDQLISYYAWAEDRGPDGAVRRSESDLFFAEIRPFEEIYRRGDDAQQQQQQQQQGQQGGQQSPGEKLAELQKEIVNATWKLRRTESTNKPSANFKKDAGVVRDSQEQALDQADAMIERLRDPRMKGFAETATKEMRVALDRLSEAVSRNTPATLDQALGAERAAYQALLKLQAREYQVSRQRGGGGGGGGGGQQRGGAQLDELELRDEENRYESQRQAAAPQDAARREETQVLNRLKELARRQGDVNERMKELQMALQEAQTEQEKEELRRRLKRLQEEQQEMVRDMDELQQRMAQNQNQNQNSSQSQQGQQADMAQARQQLEQARQQAQQTSEQMQNDALSQAVSSGTRTERDLQKLSQDFQQSSSQRFSEEMRNMRRQARELAEKQQDLANKLNEMKNPPQTQRRSLAGDGLKDEITAGLNQQRTNYANIVERMKQVSQDAETAEPLLSRQLEESVRKLGQENTEQALERAEELVRRNFPVQAGPLENQARQQIEQLRQSVDQAARRILGDETEALRTASRELDELARRLEAEAPGASGREGTNTVARASGGNREGQEQQPGEDGQQQQQASSRQRGQGQQPGEGQGENAQAQAQENQEGQEGQQPGGRGGRNPQRQQAQAQNPGEGQGQGGGQNREAGENQEPGAGPRNFFDNLRADGARNNRGGAARGGPAGEEGPITGEDFRQWADRLRDVQDMLDEPNLRNELNGILDRARNLRSDFKRHSKTPEWNLLQTQLLNPLVEVRQRVAEELARRNASGVAPLDRDPVPGRYSELVSRYYQTLGEGAAVGEEKKPQ